MNQSAVLALSTLLLPAAISVGSHAGFSAGVLALPIAAWGGARYVAALEATGLSPRLASILGAFLGSFAGLAAILLAAGGCCGSMH